MSIEENKKLVRRYFEDDLSDLHICREIFAPRFQFHTIQHASITPQTVESNPESEKAAYEWLTSVWGKDRCMTIDEMIAENDRVMVRWTFSGKHVGEFSGLPATNKEVTYSGINIFLIASGRIAEIWDIWDRLWVWQQLGVLPEIKEAIAAARQNME
jgi:steroid delta-isomerase-like uncharacterized protein